MEKKHLQSMIENLHRELESANSVDEESRAMFQEHAKDV